MFAKFLIIVSIIFYTLSGAVIFLEDLDHILVQNQDFQKYFYENTFA